MVDALANGERSIDRFGTRVGAIILRLTRGLSIFGLFAVAFAQFEETFQRSENRGLESLGNSIEAIRNLLDEITQSVSGGQFDQFTDIFDELLTTFARLLRDLVIVIGNTITLIQGVIMRFQEDGFVRGIIAVADQGTRDLVNAGSRILGFGPVVAPNFAAAERQRIQERIDELTASRTGIQARLGVEGLSPRVRENLENAVARLTTLNKWVPRGTC